jgi:acetyl esterase/lipase
MSEFATPSNPKACLPEAETFVKRLVIPLVAASLLAAVAHGQSPSPAPGKIPGPIPPPPADVTLIQDIQYGTAAGTPLYLHLSLPKPLPEKPAPVIIIVHGGGWQDGNRNANLMGTYKFAGSGFASASIEYRLTRQAPWPAQIQDCKCAVRYLRANAAKYHIDPAHIGALGDSAGGHLVAMMGLTDGIAEFEGDGGNAGVSSHVQAVCDMFGPTDLVAYLYAYPLDHAPDQNPGMIRFLGGPVFDHLATLWKASPMAYVNTSATTPPFLILHGDHDPHVPLQQSLNLADALQKKGDDVTIRIQLNEEHGGRFFFPNAYPDMLAFFNRTLRPQSR